MRRLNAPRLLALSGLIALLASCSSTNNNNPGGSNPELENPIEAVPDNPIEIPDDGGREITVDGNTIYVDGVAYAVIEESTGFVRNPDGKIIGVIGSDHDGTNGWWTFTPYPEGGAQYYFSVEDGRVVINWERSQVDIGWGAPVPPRPEHPIQGTPEQMNQLTPDQKRRAAEARARFKRALK